MVQAVKQIERGTDIKLINYNIKLINWRGEKLFASTQVLWHWALASISLHASYFMKENDSLFANYACFGSLVLN